MLKTSGQKKIMSKSHTVDSNVLFQKLGKTWYVFTEINNEMVFSALPDDVDPHQTSFELISVIEEHMEKVSKAYKPGRENPDAA